MHHDIPIGRAIVLAAFILGTAWVLYPPHFVLNNVTLPPNPPQG